MIKWAIDLDGLKSGKHTVETFDGAYRTGKITEVRYSELEYTERGTSRTVKVPSAVVMGDDNADLIEFRFIKRISKE